MGKSAKLLLNQWKNAQDKSFDNSLGFMTEEDVKEYWEHPRESMVKVSIDVAIYANSSSYCLSMVARDHTGDLLAAFAGGKHGQITRR